MSTIQEITIMEFIKKYNYYLSQIPFEVNEVTFQNFIDYYSLNFELCGVTIINNNYNPLDSYKEDKKLSQQEILDIMQKIKHMFRVIISIDASILAEHLDLDEYNLKYLMFNYGKDAGINFFYSTGFYYNRDRV